MATTEIVPFLKCQAKGYKKHQDIVKTTETTLNRQYRIQQNRTIPKLHRPKPPFVVHNNTKFVQEFNKEFATFFFERLQEAILQNTIALELEKSRCLNILMQTEKELHHSTEPPQLISKLYTNFLEQLNIKDHVISPELQRKLQTIHSSSPPPEANTPSKPLKKRSSTHQRKKRRQSQKQRAKMSDNDTSIKRKSTTSHPPAKKQLKMDHFLVQSHNLTLDPT